MAKGPDSTSTHQAQAPVESAVRAALAALGRFDAEDVNRTASTVMGMLSPSSLRTIASSGMAQSHLIAPLVTQATAQNTQAKLAFNIHGPAMDPGRFGTGAFGKAGIGPGGWGAGVYAALSSEGGDSGSSKSGAKYDALAKGDWNSPAGQAQMRAYAHEQGVGWAADNSDLLRLGPSAIKTLAEVHFKRESYKQMKDAGFTARDVVGLANYAKEKEVDANKLAGSTADVVKGDPQDTLEERERRRKAMNEYFKQPDNEEKQNSLRKELETYGKRGHGQHEKVERFYNNSALKRATVDADQKIAIAKSKEPKAVEAKKEVAALDDMFVAPEAKTSTPNKPTDAKIEKTASSETSKLSETPKPSTATPQQPVKIAVKPAANNLG